MKSKSSGFISWGTGLVIAIVLFMASTLGFVFFSTTLNFDMVTEHHYEKGVEYQNVIDRIENSNRLSSTVEFQYSKTNQSLGIKFPKDVEGITKSGSLKLYRPDDASMDQTQSLSNFEAKSITLEELSLSPGKWTAQLNWTADGVNYYSESTLFVE